MPMFKSLKKVIIINCLEAKCYLCKDSDLIVSLMTCTLKQTNPAMQAFTRITGLICSCLVISINKNTMKERNKG